MTPLLVPKAFLGFFNATPWRDVKIVAMHFRLSLSACIRRVVADNTGYWKKINELRPRKPGRSIEDTSNDASNDDEDKVQQIAHLRG